MKPRLYYDSYRRAYYLQWDVSDHVGWQEMIFERTREYICGLADENAKLRNELANAPKCEACEAMLDCDECLRADGSHKERRRLSTDNAKLREHLNELLMIGSFNGSCRRDCRYMDDCLADRFGQPDCFVCQELQELGIEVSE